MPANLTSANHIASFQGRKPIQIEVVNNVKYKIKEYSHSVQQYILLYEWNGFIEVVEALQKYLWGQVKPNLSSYQAK